MSVLSIFKNLPFIEKFTSGGLLDNLDSNRSSSDSDFSEKTQEQIKNLLSSKYSAEILEGIRMIQDAHARGKPVSEFLPNILFVLPNPDPDVKQLAHYLMLELIHRAKDKNVVLLSISPLHKETINHRALVRANSIQVMTTLLPHSPEIKLILFASMKKLVLDSNAAVRKTLLLSLFNIYMSGQNDEIDPEEIKKLPVTFFKDIPFNQGIAFVIYELVSKHNDLEFFHPYYRKACQDILKYNPEDAVLLMNLIHRYAVKYLSEFKHEVKEGKKTYVDPDFLLLINTVNKVCYKQNLPLIIEASQIALDLFEPKHLDKILSHLLTYLNSNSELKYLVLKTLESFAIKHPQLLNSSYRKFFCFRLDKSFCKVKKIEILYHLADELNVSEIFEEIHYQATAKQKLVSKTALTYLGKLAAKIKRASSKCIKVLVTLVASKDPREASNAVLALTEYLSGLSKEEKLPVLCFCLINFDKIESSLSRLHMLNSLLDYINELPVLALKCYASVVNSFRKESKEVKLKSLELGLLMSRATNELLSLHKESLLRLFSLNIQLATFDQNCIVRDYARLIALLKERPSTKVLKVDRTSASEVPFSALRYKTGYLSNIIGGEVPGYKTQPTKAEIEKISTTHLREESVEDCKQRKKNEEEEKEAQLSPELSNTNHNEQQHETQNFTQAQQTQLPTFVETIPVQEEVEKDLIQNAQKDLEDFFSDEEEK